MRGVGAMRKGVWSCEEDEEEGDGGGWEDGWRRKSPDMECVVYMEGCEKLLWGEVWSRAQTMSACSWACWCRSSRIA